MENSRPYLQALVKACQKMNITFRKVDDFGNVLAIDIGGKEYYFSNTRTPLNNEAIASICLNKIYTYMLLKDELPMPKTIGYIDPKSDLDLKKYGQFNSIKEIAKNIEQEFEFPVIIKMNSGAQGMHVYKNDSFRRIVRAIKSVFNKRQKNYDFSVIAQQFIEIENEYRAIVLDGEIILLYEKVSKNKNINLSPLHNADGKAVIIEDEEVKIKIQEIISKSPKLKDMPWIGLDVAKDFQGNWWIIELNTHPGFSYFIRDNGDEPLVEMYEKVLNRLQHGKK